jgi:ribosomal protein RSM22 (predicted rRNA methylase)
MIAALPAALSQAIQAEIAPFSGAQIQQAADRLSLAYRGKGALPAALSPVERAAYLAVRFPSTIAAANAVWTDASRAIGVDAIRSVLDAGSGPGTASFAATAHAPQAAFTCVERDAGWRDVSARLANALGVRVAFEHADFARHTASKHDVVVACYALGELPAEMREATVAKLWSLAKTALILIEPGTPKGFDIVKAARAHCLVSGGHAGAPCTHDAPCPMTTEDWCHRPVRVARSAVHRAAKRADLAYEDEKFAYVVMTREPAAHAARGRIVRKPMRGSGHVHLDVCEEAGLQRRTIARSDAAHYRDARDASWGDLWPPQDD